MMIVLIGIAIGFLGYVMINNINLSIIEITAQGKKRKLVHFMFWALLMEGLYCFFSLYCLQALMAYPKIILTAQYISVAFLFFLGFWSLFEKVKDEVKQQDNIIKRGYWSIFIHPQQIPFWFFWGIILIKKEHLNTSISSFLIFSLANAIGSLIVLVAYACYGNKIISLLKLRRKHLKNAVGIICIVSGIILLYDIIKAA